jgi:hypothetical protein
MMHRLTSYASQCASSELFLFLYAGHYNSETRFPVAAGAPGLSKANASVISLLFQPILNSVPSADLRLTSIALPV